MRWQRRRGDNYGDGDGGGKIAVHNNTQKQLQATAAPGRTDKSVGILYYIQFAVTCFSEETGKLGSGPWNVHIHIQYKAYVPIHRVCTRAHTYVNAPQSLCVHLYIRCALYILYIYKCKIYIYVNTVFVPGAGTTKLGVGSFDEKMSKRKNMATTARRRSLYR